MILSALQKDRFIVKGVQISTQDNQLPVQYICFLSPSDKAFYRAPENVDQCVRNHLNTKATAALIGFFPVHQHGENQSFFAAEARLV